MFTHDTIIRLITLLVLGSSLYSNASDARINFYTNIHCERLDIPLEEIGKAGLVLGAIGLATYGIIKLGNWLFNQSDEALADEAQQCINEVSSHYAPITVLLNNTYPDSFNCKECINNVSEQVLYELAKAKHSDADIAIYLKQLAKTTKKLENQAKNLRNRIHILQAKLDQNYETHKIITKMQTLEKQIQSTLPTLKFAYDYLKHHESFFALFEVEDAMMYRYEKDLRAADSHDGDINYIRDMIHQSVMLYQRQHHVPYPYRWYLTRLEADISTMHIAINKLSYEYTNRYNVATALCNKLEFIRETLIGSSFYADELHAYEYAKLAQAAIDAQERQARAQEKQARELHRQNNLRAQKYY